MLLVWEGLFAYSSLKYLVFIFYFFFPSYVLFALFLLVSHHPLLTPELVYDLPVWPARFSRDVLCFLNHGSLLNFIPPSRYHFFSFFPLRLLCSLYHSSIDSLLSFRHQHSWNTWRLLRLRTCPFFYLPLLHVNSTQDKQINSHGWQRGGNLSRR